MKLLKNGKVLKENLTRAEIKDIIQKEHKKGNHKIYLQDKQIILKKKKK